MFDDQAKPVAAFLIPELLEEMLLQVDMQELLVSALRVCKQWHQVITESPRLQRHLFLLEDKVSSPRHNPLLERCFPFLFEHALSSTNETEYYSLTEERMDPDDRPFPEMPWPMDKMAAFERPQASWKRMLVHQPPLYGIGRVTTIHTFELLYSQRLLHNSEPLKAPALISEVLRRIPLNDQHKIENVALKSAFRVLWRQLPQDILNLFPEETEEHEGDNGSEVDHDGDIVMAGIEDVPPSDSSSPSDASSQTSMERDELVKIRNTFDEQMGHFGITIHSDICSHIESPLDPRQYKLYEILGKLVHRGDEVVCLP
ncbi:putative F-box domain-containing protein [Seiridium unicorne]|uniref:F-box domain-containing protein n=1 Tax=Seiridium unicorne TaxID=138068 RepID=A0ABR2VCL5_9PEZI